MSGTLNSAELVARSSTVSGSLRTAAHNRRLVRAVCELVSLAQEMATQASIPADLVGGSPYALPWENENPNDLAAAGRWDDAVVHWRDTLHRLGNPMFTPRLWVNASSQLADALIETGQWDAAQSCLAQARYLCLEGLDAITLDLQAGLVSCRAGYVLSAKELLARVDLAMSSGPSPAAMSSVQARRGLLSSEIAMAEGDLVRARDELTSIREATELRADPQMWRVLLLAARVEVDVATCPATPRRRSGPGIDPEQRLDDIERLGAEVFPVGDLGTACSSQLDAERARLTHCDEVDQWQAVVDAWQVTGQVYEQAWAMVRLGACQLRLGSRVAAEVTLQQAARTGTRLGAAQLIESASALTRRSGIDVRRGGDRLSPNGAAHPHGLTSRELEVLRLITEGCSNKDLAKQLFISPKTASVHVSRILTKLGVASRSQATTVAHRLHLL